MSDKTKTVEAKTLEIRQIGLRIMPHTVCCNSRQKTRWESHTELERLKLKKKNVLHFVYSTLKSVKNTVRNMKNEKKHNQFNGGIGTE